MAAPGNGPGLAEGPAEVRGGRGRQRGGGRAGSRERLPSDPALPPRSLAHFPGSFPGPARPSVPAVPARARPAPPGCGSGGSRPVSPASVRGVSPQTAESSRTPAGPGGCAGQRSPRPVPPGSPPGRAKPGWPPLKPTFRMGPGANGAGAFPSLSCWV